MTVGYLNAEESFDDLTQDIEEGDCNVILYYSKWEHCCKTMVAALSLERFGGKTMRLTLSLHSFFLLRG